MDINAVILEINDIDNQQQLSAFLRMLATELKLQYYWFGVGSANSNLTELLVENYPREFHMAYFSKSLFRLDPVVIYAFSKLFMPMTWSELFDVDLLREENRVSIDLAAQFDIKNGITCPAYIGNNNFSLLHCPIESARYQNAEELSQLKKYLTTIAGILHYKASYLLSKKNDLWMRLSLTPREIECVIWAARGKTIAETSIILGISENTVRDYLVNAQKKNKVANKCELVAKLIINGLITFEDLQFYW